MAEPEPDMLFGNLPLLATFLSMGDNLVAGFSQSSLLALFQSGAELS